MLAGPLEPHSKLVRASRRADGDLERTKFTSPTSITLLQFKSNMKSLTLTLPIRTFDPTMFTSVDLNLPVRHARRRTGHVADAGCNLD